MIKFREKIKVFFLTEKYSILDYIILLSCIKTLDIILNGFN